MKRRRLPLLAVTMAACMAVLGGGIWLVFRLLPDTPRLPFQREEQIIDFHTYFSLNPDVTGVIVGDSLIVTDTPPVVENGEIFLPCGFVRQYMDAFLFWDEYAGILFMTTDEDILQFTPDSLEYRFNGERAETDAPVKLIGGAAYMPAALVGRLYPYHISYAPEYNMVLIDHTSYEHSIAAATDKTEIYYRPDKTAPQARKAEKNEHMLAYGEEDGFIYVRTEDGLLGYVPEAALELLEPPAPYTEPDAYQSKRPIWPADRKINMMWEAVYSGGGNDSAMQSPLPEGVNVIAPTWFTIDEETLDVLTLGSRDYAEWAHTQGVEVWAMFADEKSAVTHELLTDYDARRRAVSRLVEYAAHYGLDGVNIDFEHVREDDGEYFIQFLRELAIELRKTAVILSVDVYVPAAWSAYYRRDLIGMTADFVCVMTYDEHWPGSPDSGPVASLPFVRKGVEDMLAMVPKEKLLMGLPFYNRVWRELNGNDSPETRRVSHLGMEGAKALFDERAVTPEWDAAIGCYYGEYGAVEDGEAVLYRIWLEDEYSIAEKLKIYTEHELAGVAGWNRGFVNEITARVLKDVVR